MKGRKANQKINQMAYDRLQSEHSYKNLIRGIETSSWTEKYTSTTCCVCGACNPEWRRHRGLWVCGKCRLVLQADLNGAGNLLKQNLFGDCCSKALPFAFWEPRVWRWDKRSNQFVQASPRAAA
jgi:putative transposase